jgi:hypothetical protein
LVVQKVVVAPVALVVGSLLEQGLALEQDSQGVGARHDCRLRSTSRVVVAIVVVLVVAVEARRRSRSRGGGARV